MVHMGIINKIKKKLRFWLNQASFEMGREMKQIDVDQNHNQMNIMWLVFDSCRYDSLVEAATPYLDKQESKDDDKSLAINMEEYVDAVAAYIDQLKEQTVNFYSKILDTLSLKSIRKAFDESIAMLRKYAYDMPVEFIEENVVHPISSFPGKVKEYVDYQVNNIWTKTPDKSFSAEDIRDILNKALEAKVENNSKLEQTVMNMDRDLKAYSNTAKARLYQQGRSFTHDEVRLALHNL